MGSKWFADEIFEILVQNKNVEVTVGQLEKATGKSRHQVQGAINNLRRRKGAVIVSPSPGRVFVYQGMAPAENVEREDGSVVSEPKQPAPIEAMFDKVEQRLANNPDNKPATTVKTPGGTLVGKFVMPKPHTDNEFMRVISRTNERVLLEDAHGKVWRATEI